MRAHVIKDGIVVNTIEINKFSDAPQLTLRLATLGGKIGDSWDGVKFTSPPPAPKSQEEIKAEILALDLRRIRPLAEGDTEYLATLNVQIKALRDQLQ